MKLEKIYPMSFQVFAKAKTMTLKFSFSLATRKRRTIFSYMDSKDFGSMTQHFSSSLLIVFSSLLTKFYVCKVLKIIRIFAFLMLNVIYFYSRGINSSDHFKSIFFAENEMKIVSVYHGGIYLDVRKQHNTTRTIKTDYPTIK